MWDSPGAPFDAWAALWRSGGVLGRARIDGSAQPGVWRGDGWHREPESRGACTASGGDAGLHRPPPSLGSIPPVSGGPGRFSGATRQPGSGGDPLLSGQPLSGASRLCGGDCRASPLPTAFACVPGGGLTSPARRRGERGNRSRMNRLQSDVGG